MQVSILEKDDIGSLERAINNELDRLELSGKEIIDITINTPGTAEYVFYIGVITYK